MFRRGPLFLAALVIFACFTPVPATAHSTAFFTPKWKTTSPDWAYTTSFPLGAYRDRISSGVSQWNARNQSVKFYFVQQTRANYAYASCNLPYNQNSVHWYSLDGPDGNVARAYRCVDKNLEILDENLVVDKDEKWYTGTGDAGPLQYDLWSVTAHEWGHMFGWYGHYAQSESICANQASQETMCPFYNLGTERWRTLGTHDGHTFDAAY